MVSDNSEVEEVEQDADIVITSPAYSCVFRVSLNWAKSGQQGIGISLLSIIPEPPRKGLSFRIGENYGKVVSVDYDLAEHVYLVKMGVMIFEDQEKFQAALSRIVDTLGWVRDEEEGDEEKNSDPENIETE